MIPKVSVIIPVYGVEKYIERCARSLFQQTLDDIEFLFIDDCTPDRSIDILKMVLEEYPYRKNQVRIHQMECNSGQARVREWGMKNAKGEYIIHCDSDDWVDTDMYRLMYYKGIEVNADIVICDYFVHNGIEMLKYQKGICNSIDVGELIKDASRDRIAFALWNKLIKRECINWIAVYPQHNMGEDMTMILQILFGNPKVSYVAKGLYYYFTNEQSIMRQVSKETTIRNYNHLNNNVKTLKDGLYKNCKYEENESVVDYLYYRTSNILMPYIFDKDIYQLWRKHFKNINIQVLKNKNISLARKIRHIILLLHLNFFNR